MVYAVIGIHTIVSLGLILAILLHSGKGAGLSNVFGGGLPSSFSGTSMIEKNLDRITIGLAATFAVTTFVLMLTMPKDLTTAPVQQQQQTTGTPTGPGGTAPGGTAPGGTAPGGTAPGGTAPGGTAPGGTAPRTPK